MNMAQKKTLWAFPARSVYKVMFIHSLNLDAEMHLIRCKLIFDYRYEVSREI